MNNITKQLKEEKKNITVVREGEKEKTQKTPNEEDEGGRAEEELRKKRLCTKLFSARMEIRRTSVTHARNHVQSLH
jgi:hypothetical protein